MGIGVQTILMNLVRILVLFGIVLALIGCAGNDGSSGGALSVRITPNVLSLEPGKSKLFTAVVSKVTSDELQWSVDGGAANGTITSDGKYTAPTTTGVYIVRCTIANHPEAVATATVTVSKGVSIKITANNPAPKMIPRSRLDFVAEVTGADNKLVSWSATGGTIDGSGRFVAPTTPGTYTITAKSNADTSVVAEVNVEVVADLNVRFTFAGKGDVDLDLAVAEAPGTCANMVSLVNAKFYDGIVMHRYEENFVIQGGDPLTKTLPLDDPSIGTGGPGYTIPFEANSLLHEHYALGMARSQAMDSGGSQWYICLDALPSLDGNYCVFGKVASGQSVVDELRRGDKITRAVVIPATP